MISKLFQIYNTFSICDPKSFLTMETSEKHLNQED
jgi:hypothetical protein